MLDYALSSQQLAVICALSSGATIAEAAEESGVHRNTVANWRRNLLPFQRALADAQYARALLFREKAEALAGQAFQTIQDLLADPKTPASVRLKAALAIIQTVSTPPPPKKQLELIMETVQPAPTAPQPGEAASQPDESAKATATPPSEHNSAQTPYRREGPKIGRNDACPCGSGLKYKRCCLDQPHAAAA